MKDKGEEKKYKEEEIMLVILKNLETQIVPISFSIGGLVGADPIIVLKRTLWEIFLNLQEKN